jgi:hypothetical protein
MLLTVVLLGAGFSRCRQPDSKEIKSLIMASDLREDGLRRSQNDSEASVFPHDDGNGLSQGAIWPQGLPTAAPWSNLSWGLFLPLVFAGNVVLATLAWIIVGIVMK